MIDLAAHARPPGRDRRPPQRARSRRRIVSSGALDACSSPPPTSSIAGSSPPADEIVELLLTGQGKKIEARPQGQWHMRARSIAPSRPRPGAPSSTRCSTWRPITSSHRWTSKRWTSKRWASILPAPSSGCSPPPPPRAPTGAWRSATRRWRSAENKANSCSSAAPTTGPSPPSPGPRRALFPDELALRSKKLFDEPIARVRGLRVEGGGRVQRFGRTAAGAYTLLEPKGEGLNPDLGLCADLVQLVTTLTVDRWVGPGDDKAYGLAAPRLSIEVDLAGEGSEGKTLRVLLGAAASSGSFARAAGEDAVFVAPRALEDAASRWLLDRGSLRIDAETIKTATLTAPGGKKLVVEQAGGVFRVAGAGADPASAARAATIRDALADLSAETAVGVGKPEKHHGLDAPRLTIVIDRQNPLASDKLPPARLVVGAGDSVDGTSIFYVRRDRIDATWAVAQAKIRPLLEALGEK
ncbi:MAG: DUF4340 domain-containing protein [Byssovorax sp.]